METLLDDQIKKPEILQISEEEKTQVNLIVQKIAELIREKHL